MKAAGKWKNLGMGLYAWVNKDGSRFYRFRAKLGGRLVQIGLGRIESAQAARGMAADLRERLRREISGLAPRRMGVAFSEILTRRIDDRAPRVAENYLKRIHEFSSHLVRIVGGDRDAYSMSRDDVRAYLRKRSAEGASNSTINRELTFARSAFRAAILDEIIAKNPFDGIERLPEPESDEIVNIPDDRTLQKILIQADESSPWLRSLVMTLIGTGERVSAVLGLQRSHLDFERRAIHFPAKNRKGRRGKKVSRTIPMPKALISILRELVTELTEPGYIFYRRKGERGKERMTLNTVRTGWVRSATRAGVIVPRLHDLRHLVVSQLGRSGVSPTLTRTFIGHKTDNMTRRYTHLSTDDLQSPADVLSGVISRFSGESVNRVSTNVLGEEEPLAVSSIN